MNEQLSVFESQPESSVRNPDFRLLFESAPDLYLVLSPDLKIVAASDAYLQATMTNRQEILGRGVFEVFPDNPDTPDASGARNVAASLARVLRSRVSDTMAVQKYDVRRPESDGGGFEERYWSPTNCPVFGRDNVLQYIIHRVTDVTEFVRLKQRGGEQERIMEEMRSRGQEMESEIFQRAQEIQEVNTTLRGMAEELTRALTAEREVTEKLNLALDSGEVGTWTWDPCADLINADEFMERLFGFQAGGFPSRLADFLTYLHPDDRQRVEADVDRSAQNGSEYDTEYRVICPDGSQRVIAARGKVSRDEHDRIVRMSGVCWDLTGRKRAEEEIRRLNAELEQRVAVRTAELAETNRDLAQKNQENEMFVYSVSHDLRSPLVNLQGFSKELVALSHNIRDLLVSASLPPEIEQRGVSLVDCDMQRCTHFIQTAVSRLSSIIDALLRLSRAGRVEYQLQAVDTHTLVTRIIEAMSVTIYERGASVDIGDLPAAWGDTTALEQVFANLIGNAVNYLDPNRPGRIEIGSQEAVAPSNVVKGWTTYYIKDNGLGIPDAYHNKVFQALKRLHPEVAKGEGMGLAIVRRIVERHGGTIRFESAVGLGTTFFVTLPSAESNPQSPVPNHSSKQERNVAYAS